MEESVEETATSESATGEVVETAGKTVEQTGTDAGIEEEAKAKEGAGDGEEEEKK